MPSFLVIFGVYTLGFFVGYLARVAVEKTEPRRRP